MGKLQNSPNGLSEPIKVWANNGFGKGARFGWFYIEKSQLNNIPEKVLKSRKVMISIITVIIVLFIVLLSILRLN